MVDRGSEAQKQHLEKKMVFPNDDMARYIFFALRHDLGGLGGYRLGFRELVILMDTYFDTPELKFSRQGETRRFREEWSGSAPTFRRDRKKRARLREKTLSYQKVEAQSDRAEAPGSIIAEGLTMARVARIQSFRMIIAVLSEDKRPLGIMHCDQSSSIQKDGSVGKPFYEIELHYPPEADYATPMNQFSDTLQRTFNLSITHRSKLERALHVTFNQGGNAS